MYVEFHFEPLVKTCMLKVVDLAGGVKQYGAEFNQSYYQMR